MAHLASLFFPIYKVRQPVRYMYNPMRLKTPKWITRIFGLWMGQRMCSRAKPKNGKESRRKIARNTNFWMRKGLKQEYGNEH